MRSQKIGLRLSDLPRKHNTQIIEQHVRGLIEQIDAVIESTHMSGFHEITYELPTNFPVDNMSKSDAQLYVYSEVVGQYALSEDAGGKGFTEVRLRMPGVAVGAGANAAAARAGASSRAGSGPTLHIKWANGMDDEERRQRKKLLDDYIV